MASTRGRAAVQLPAALAVLAATLLVTPSSAHAAATSISLGAAESYGVLAATTVTSSGFTTVAGNVGVSPGSAVTGFPPGIVTGGTIHTADSSSSQAQTDLATAYAAAAGQPVDTVLPADVGGLTLAPGVYHATTSLAVNGTVTFDAQGDPGAVFLIQTGTTLITGTNSAVDVINGGFQSNVFWQIGSSATLGVSTDFAGTLMAFTSVTVNTGASIAGRALAVNGAVTLDTNDVSRPSAPTVPDAPTALTVDPGDESADLTFLPPADNGGSVITGYEVSTNGTGGWTGLPTSPGTGGTRTATVSGLTNGTEYLVAVRAVNLVGPSEPTGYLPVTPATFPGAPTALSSEPANGGAVLTFSPPVDDGGSPVTRYEISTDNGTNWTTLTTTAGTGGSLHATVTGLVNGTAHQVLVRAVNIVAAGSTAATTFTPQAVPGPPTDLTADPANGGARLTFIPPADDGGSAITRYEISTDNGTNWTTLTTTAGAGTSRHATVTGLTNGTLAEIQVRAVNIVGPGPVATTTVTPQAVPGPPTDLTASPVGNTAVLTFAPPIDDGGSAITSYDSSIDDGATWQPLPVTGAGATRTGTVTGLADGAHYDFTVRAHNSVGPGPAADSVPVDLPGAPGAPTDLATVAGDTSVQVTFTPPVDDGGSAITSYDVSTDNGGMWTTVTTTAGTGGRRFATVTGLVNGTDYQLKLRAVNAVDAGPASVAVTASPATVPGAPTGLTAETAGNGITVTFTSPADNGGSALIGYQVSKDDGSTWTALTVDTLPGDGRTGLVTGLTGGTSYTLRVRAVNGVGPGARSVPATAVAGSRSPTNVTVTAGQSSIVVSWVAPTAGNVTRYTVVASPGPATCTTTGELTCVLGGIAGTSYTVTVIATADGADSASLPSDSVVPDPPVVADTAPETNLLLSTTQGDISKARRGQRIVVTGGGFLPYSTVAVTLYADPARRTLVVARGDGTFSVPIRIPTSLATGDYVIVAAGTDRFGTTRIMKLPFAVPPETTSPDPGGHPWLPTTGPPLSGTILFGLTLSLAGALLYLAGGLPARRRYGYRPTHSLASHIGH